ncbi:hypothetical protein Hanom_Chr07g00619111 [Helianthus anomalus]
MPKQTIILSPPSYGSDTGPPQTYHYKGHFYVLNEAPIAYSAGEREWRPPWRPVETTLNATNRTEWRPPWSLSSVLEDKDIFNGAGMIRDSILVNPRSPCTPTKPCNSFRFYCELVLISM